MTENKIQARIIRKLRNRHPDWFVFPMDGNDYQGFPDILILYKDTYAVLEVKQYEDSERQPNQDYYIEYFGEYVYSSFIWPDIEEEVLDELQQAFLLR